MQMPAHPAQGALSQQDLQTGMTMPYGGVGDSHQMWSGAGQMQSSDYCGVPMATQYPCAPQSPELQHMAQMSAQQMMPMQQQQQMMPMQQPMLPQMAMQQPMQMVPMAQGELSPQMHMQQQMQMSQMQMPQMPLQQMQMPQMAMSPVQTPTASGESTPTGMQTPAESVRSECMAILMPQASQLNCDMLAAQLQASAEQCNCYED